MRWQVLRRGFRSEARFRLLMAMGLVCGLVASLMPVCAQEASRADEPALKSNAGTTGLNLAEVQAALVAIETDAGIDISVKDLLRAKYRQAINALQEASDYAARTAEYRELIRSGKTRTAELRNQLLALPTVEIAAQVTATTGDNLQEDIETKRVALAQLHESLLKLSKELHRVRVRPIEIGARLPDVQQELTQFASQLDASQLIQDATSVGRVAERTLLQAEQARLLCESEMLEQELSSQFIREILLQAQYELLTRQVENASAALSAALSLLHASLVNEVEDVIAEAKTLAQSIPKGDQAASKLASEVQDLATELRHVVDSANRVEAARDAMMNRRQDLEREYEGLREHLKLGSAGQSAVQALFDLQSLALQAHTRRGQNRLPTLDETRAASFEVRQNLRLQPQLEQQFAGKSDDALVELIAIRKLVLEKLQTQYGNLIRSQALLKADRELYLEKAEEINAYVAKQFFGFGIRSCPVISIESITDIPSGVGWTLGSEHWSELGQALQWTFKSRPVSTVSVLFIVTMLLLSRPWIKSALTRNGQVACLPSTDRYVLTVEALIWTCLLAAPVPLLSGFAGWSLSQAPKPSHWMWGMVYGVQIAAITTMTTEFLAAMCLPHGLGAAHFGWQKVRLSRFRSAIQRFTVVYVSTLLCVTSCAYGDAAQYSDNIGRFSFILAHAWIMIIMWRLFGGVNGIFAIRTHEPQMSPWATGRLLGVLLILACPLALIVIACLGYLITAFEFSLGFLATAARVFGGMILYALMLRWFALKQRRLARAEGGDRDVSSEESLLPEETQQRSEPVSIDAQPANERDLKSISEQTRAVLRLLFSVAVAYSIIVFWSETLPLTAVLETITVPLTGGRSLLALVQSLLILVVTCLVTKSLPGILELAVLRATQIDSGTRAAVETLCQYAVVAVGLFASLSILEVDWAKFGWIAAALSVGLGFGLQEVVANFVCGLILMFERPVRVGDVITVEGVTGTVTKIRIRATTITNWDRQEFVAPNKLLITGTLLNWTLANPLNRITIPVGVAYGSDTAAARQILLDVAADHPLVLADPAPIATFEEFADSSLHLLLRAYLPDLDNRLKIITELHTEIDRRFAAAGVEIAFPQRDLHLRGDWQASLRSNISQAGESPGPI